MSYFLPLQLVVPPSDLLVDLPLPPAAQLVLAGMSVLISALLLAVVVRPGAGSSGLTLRRSAQVSSGLRPRPGGAAPLSRRSRSPGARRAAPRRSSERGGTRAP